MIVKEGVITSYSYDGDGSRVRSSTLPFNAGFVEGDPLTGWNRSGATLLSDTTRAETGSRSIKVESTGSFRCAVQSVSTGYLELINQRTVTLGGLGLVRHGRESPADDNRR